MRRRKPFTWAAVQLTMVRLGKNFGCAVFLAAAVLFPLQHSRAQAPQAAQSVTAQMPAASPAKPAQGATHRSHKKKAPAVAEVSPTPPQPPPTLEQSPPTAPRISYLNGQLTIEAHNSTLSQVLRAVQLQTGASIDIPAGASSERVVGQIGPGQPREVLNTLLNGSKFDYMILGVTGNPGAVQKVILTPRQSSPSSVSAAQNNSAAQPQEPMQEEDPQPDEGVTVPDTAEMENQNPDQPPPTPGGFRRPIPQPQGNGEPGQAFNNGDQQNGVKTPEQLMQELQQMQQQQQQYQQQLNPANQNPPQ